MNKAIKLIGEATAEQIKAWKEKYKTIYAIEVKGHVCYVKAVDRLILSLVMSVVSANPLEANETIFNNCWLGGSEDIKTDDELYCSAIMKMGELIDLKSATLKKL